MKKFVFIIFIVCMAMSAHADIASTTYVSQSNATKVDTSANAKQTMAGNYTVSGTLVVPTPPLPTAE